MKMKPIPAHLSESDLAEIEKAKLGTPPNAAEWAIYLRKRDEEQACRVRKQRAH